MSQPDDDKTQTQTHMMLSTGTMVYHYRIIEKIGVGGIGKVYLAGEAEKKRSGILEG